MITINGFLGMDAELRYTQSGKAVTKFSVAESRKFTRGGEEVKETTWYRVSCWGELAEACAHLNKGTRVKVEGSLAPDPETGGPRVWQRKDGTWSASYDVTAFKVEKVEKPDEEIAV